MLLYCFRFLVLVVRGIVWLVLCAAIRWKRLLLVSYGIEFRGMRELDYVLVEIYSVVTYILY